MSSAELDAGLSANDLKLRDKEMKRFFAPVRFISLKYTETIPSSEKWRGKGGWTAVSSDVILNPFHC